MDYIYLKDFFTFCTVPTIIVAVIVAIIYLVAVRVFGDKIPVVVKKYLPFMLSIALYILYDMIFVCKGFILRLESLSAGMLAGSLTLVFLSAIRRIKNGEPLNLSVTVLLIKSLVSGYVSEENELIIAERIDHLILTNGYEESEQLTGALVGVLKDNSITLLPDSEYLAIAKIIFRAVKALKVK